MLELRSEAASLLHSRVDIYSQIDFSSFSKKNKKSKNEISFSFSYPSNNEQWIFHKDIWNVFIITQAKQLIYSLI